MVIVDVDDCLLQWSTSFKEFCTKAGYGFSKDWPDAYGLKDWLVPAVDDLQINQLIRDFNGSEYFASLVPIEGTEYLEQFRSLGIHAITACGKRNESRRLRNLDKYFPGVLASINCIELGTPKIDYVINLLSANGVDAEDATFIDDHINNVIDAYNLGIKSILFEQPHNKNHKVPNGIIRVNSWYKIVEILKGKAL